MRNINWEEVTTPNTVLPAGGYVIEIQDVVDHEDWEQLDIIYNVVEGQYKDIYKNMGPDDDWKHRFNQRYSERAQGFFKQFLDEIENDNQSFTIANWGNDPLKLVGNKIGILFGEYRDFNQNGKARTRLQAVRPLTIAQVRAGDFEIPEPMYKRGVTAEEWLEVRDGASADKSTSAGDASVYDDGLPF